MWKKNNFKSYKWEKYLQKNLVPLKSSLISNQEKSLEYTKYHRYPKTWFWNEIFRMKSVVHRKTQMLNNPETTEKRKILKRRSWFIVRKENINLLICSLNCNYKNIIRHIILTYYHAEVLKTISQLLFP